LLGGERRIERQLEDLYTGIYARTASVPESEARSQVREMIWRAKEAARKEGTDKLPQPYGEYLLQRERTNPETRELFARKRAEGVRDADVRSWWNLHDLERRLVVELDGISRLAVFTDQVGKGRTPDEAAVHVRRYFPMFGDPDDTTNTTGDDQSLPWELKDRVNIWMQKQRASPEAFKKRVEQSPTFNALVRAEISAGRL